MNKVQRKDNKRPEWKDNGKKNFFGAATFVFNSKYKPQ